MKLKKNIILFGSSGLIGSSLKKNLNKNYNIIGIDKKKSLNTDILLDTSKFKFSEKIIKKIIKKHKKIDAVIICIYPKTNIKKKTKYLNLNFKEFALEFNTHLEPFYNLNKIFINYFEKNNGGSIINFTSIYGSFLPRFEIYKKTTMNMPMYYALVKSSIIMMTRFLAKQFLHKNIKINTISPGGIFDNQNKSFLKKYGNYSASKKLLNSQDLIGLVELLISDKAKKITGQNIIIDDGFSL